MTSLASLMVVHAVKSSTKAPFVAWKKRLAKLSFKAHEQWLGCFIVLRSPQTFRIDPAHRDERDTMLSLRESRSTGSKVLDFFDRALHEKAGCKRGRNNIC